MGGFDGAKVSSLLRTNGRELALIVKVAKGKFVIACCGGELTSADVSLFIFGVSLYEGHVSFKGVVEGFVGS